MEIVFVVKGEPVGKGRPKFTTHGQFARAYTPKKTAEYEKLVREEYEKQCYCNFGSKQIGISITAYFAIPKSISKVKREQMRMGRIKPAKKPDMDNVLKSIADALNNVAYDDDKQIVYAQISKRYAEEPRAEIRIFDM